MKVTKEMREAGEKVFWNAWASSHKTAIDSFNIGLDAAFALAAQEQPASDFERIQSSYSSGSQSAPADQSTTAAPQTDAELVEELCEAQFKKGAATNIRSVLSRLAPAKENTSLHDACQVLENARQQAGKDHNE
jgi:hypothetical protein